MSVKQMAIVWELDVPQNQAHLLLALADHASDDGSSVYPSVAYLAWKTGYSDRQIQRLIKEMKDLGYLTPVAHEKGGRGHAVHYQLHLDKAPKKTPWHEVKKKGDKLTPFPDKGDTGGGERVTSEDIKGDTAMSPEPSSNHHQEPIAPPIQAVQKSVVKIRQDRIKSALVDACEENPETSSEWGKIDKAYGLINKASQHLTDDQVVSEIYRRAKNYKQRRSYTEISALALANNWGKFKFGPTPSGPTYQDWTHGDPRVQR